MGTHHSVARRHTSDGRNDEDTEEYLELKNEEMLQKLENQYKARLMELEHELELEREQRRQLEEREILKKSFEEEEQVVEKKPFDQNMLTFQVGREFFGCIVDSPTIAKESRLLPVESEPLPLEGPSYYRWFDLEPALLPLEEESCESEGDVVDEVEHVLVLPAEVLKKLKEAQCQKVDMTPNELSATKSSEELSNFQKTLEVFCNSVVAHCKTQFKAMEFSDNDGTEAHFLRHFLKVESDILRFQMRRAAEETGCFDANIYYLQFPRTRSRMKSKKLICKLMENIKKDLKEINKGGPEIVPSLLAFLVLSFWNQKCDLEVMGVKVFESEAPNLDIKQVYQFIETQFSLELHDSSSSQDQSLIYEIFNTFADFNLKPMLDVMNEHFPNKH